MKEELPAAEGLVTAVVRNADLCVCCRCKKNPKHALRLGS